MRYVIGFALGVLLAGCASSNLRADLRSQIPANATSIILHHSDEAESYYGAVLRTLNQRGFSISSSEAEARIFSTNSQQVGASATSLRLSGSVDQGPLGSALHLSADYELLPSNWRPAAFRDDVRKARVAFEEVAALAEHLPHDSLSFEVNEARAGNAF